MDGGPERYSAHRRTNNLDNFLSAPRAIANARQECREANLGGRSAVTRRASGEQPEACNAAANLARHLELLGVSAHQFYALLDALLPRGWDSEEGIVLDNNESGWLLRELALLASATAMFLVLGRVAQTDASQPGLLRPPAMPTHCRNGCGRLTNVPYDTCCHTCNMGHHTSQCLDNQLRSQHAGGNGMQRSSSIHDNQETAFPRHSMAQHRAAAGHVQSRGGFQSTPGDVQARQRPDVGPYSHSRLCSASTAARDAARLFFCKSCGRKRDASSPEGVECWECIFH